MAGEITSASAAYHQGPALDHGVILFLHLLPPPKYPPPPFLWVPTMIFILKVVASAVL